MTRPFMLCALLSIVAAGCPLMGCHMELGEACTANNDCDPFHCEAALCTHTCKTDADCAGPRWR